GIEGGDVGAGAGLGITLAPDFLGGEDFRYEALLLLLGAPMDEGGADQHDAEAVDDAGGMGADHFLVVHDHLLEGRATAAVGLGPVDADPAAGFRLRM